MPPKLKEKASPTVMQKKTTNKGQVKEGNHSPFKHKSVTPNFGKKTNETSNTNSDRPLISEVQSNLQRLYDHEIFRIEKIFCFDCLAQSFAGFMHSAK